MKVSVLHRDPTSFLAVGLSVQLSLSEDQSQAQYGSSILGWGDRQWILCEWPFHLGQPIPCSVGMSCRLRYIYDGKLIGYRTEVLNTQMQPFPFLLLAFPSTLDEVPLRKHGRVLAQEPIVLTPVTNDRTSAQAEPLTRIGALLMDLSAAGCAVLLQRPAREFFMGMLVRVEFEIVGTGHVNNLTGVIRNVSIQADGTQLGLEFRFDGQETIEYRGWGGSVQKALESVVLRKHFIESA
ncbi:MAG: flagellar brake protein [Nitrospira sp.]|nr:flagellar brake protein [Nitrospira sp.]